MATDPQLIPADVADQLVAAVEYQSVALRLGTVTRMPEGVMSIPVLSAAPSADFVALGGRKPPTTVEWSAERIEPEEIAALTWIPDAYVDDAGFPIWDAARDEIAKAIARRLDRAVLFGGAGTPASYPPNGVFGAGAPLTGADALEAIDAGMAAVEASGLMPNGIASGPAIGSALRKEYRSIAALPSTSPEPTVYGVPVATTTEWDSSKGDALVGDWKKLVIGIRQDVSFDTSDSATIFDDTGTLVVSAFQDDVTVLRVYMRVGVVIGSPALEGGGTADAFVAVDWTAVAAARAEASKRTSSKG
jgi:hypothetical protein